MSGSLSPRRCPGPNAPQNEQTRGWFATTVLSMLWAIHVGGGTMAQFSIPELGGSGQWMQGGSPRGQSQPTPVPSELGRGICEDLDHLIIEQLGNV